MSTRLNAHGLTTYLSSTHQAAHQLTLNPWAKQSSIHITKKKKLGKHSNGKTKVFITRIHFYEALSKQVATHILQKCTSNRTLSWLGLTRLVLGNLTSLTSIMVQPPVMTSLNDLAQGGESRGEARRTGGARES